MSSSETEARIERMRTDTDSDWPTRLLANIAKLPVVMDERDIDNLPDWFLRNPTLELTAHELLMVGLYSRGLSSQMIADSFDVKISTVQCQFKVIRYKLRAKNTAHAACEALRRGLIS